MSPTPYHDGEIEFQKLAGTYEQAIMNGEGIQAEILGGALAFVSRQTMLVAATQDSAGNLWTSIIPGTAGFMRTPDDRHLEIDLNRSAMPASDPFLKNIRNNPFIGCLIIELDTRRRLRINGTARLLENNRLRVTVFESFPNCPKYIQKRKVSFIRDESATTNEQDALLEGVELTTEAANLISAADTLFVGTAYPPERMDVSHKGGLPGFVQIKSKTSLRIPDYFGNGMFTSFGNLTRNPRAGLAFPDFKNGHSLQLIGTAKILLDQNDQIGKTGGINRFWEFEIEHWQQQNLFMIEREFVDYSPFNPQPTSLQATPDV